MQKYFLEICFVLFVQQFTFTGTNETFLGETLFSRFPRVVNKSTRIFSWLSGWVEASEPQIICEFNCGNHSQGKLVLPPNSEQPHQTPSVLESLTKFVSILNPSCPDKPGDWPLQR